MSTQQIIADIEHILQGQFQPSRLEVIDESDLHKGHPGAKSGRPHIAVVIRARIFNGQTSLNIHRMIYQALGPIIKDSLHALRLDAKASDDSNLS